LYAHDFSEFYDLEIGANGRFGYSSLPLYWSEPGRHPFLVWVEGQLAGLLLIKYPQAEARFKVLQQWVWTASLVFQSVQFQGISPQHHLCDLNGPRTRNLAIVDHSGQGDR